MIPYATQTIDETDLAAVRAVLTSGWLTQGPAVPQFEQTFAQVHQVAHACAVSNATAGLHLACLALGVAAIAAVGEPEAFAAALQSVLDAPGDAGARRAHAAPYTWQRSAAGHRRAYALALS